MPERWKLPEGPRGGSLIQRATLTRGRRCAVLLLAGCVGAFVSLMLLSNALLSSGGLGWLIHQSTDDARLRLGYAYSPWPGRVVFRDLHLEIHDSAVHFDLKIPRGELQVDLPALLERRFEARDLEASGGVLRVRTAPAFRSREREARLPKLSAPKAGTGVTRASDLWGVAVGIRTLEFNELWLDDVRLRGRLSAQGEFDLQPLDYLEVSSARAHIEPSDVWLGDTRLIRTLRGHVQVDVPRTAITRGAGLRLLEQAALQTRISSYVERLDPLSLYLPPAFELVGGEGELSIEGGLHNLELDESTRLDYSSPKLQLNAHGLRSSGRSNLLIIRRTETFSAWTFSNVAIAAAERPTAVALIDRVKLRLETQGALHRLTVKRGSASLRQVAIEDLASIRARLPAAPATLKGSLEGNLEAHYEDARLDAKADLRVTELVAGGDRITVSGDAWLSASASARPPFKTVEFSRLNVDLRRASLNDGTRGGDRFDAALRTSRYKLARGALSGSGPLSLQLSDTQPLERAAGVDAPEIAKGLFGLRGLELTLHTELSKARQEVRIVRGRSGSARIDGRLVRQGHDVRLVLLVTRGPLSVGLAAWDGDSSVVPLAGDAWLQEQLGQM